MKRRIVNFPRARILALAVGAGVIASLASAPASMAAAPAVGTACQFQDGKVNGRGSSLQTWLVFDQEGQYTNDVCGPVQSQGANDVTDPSSPVITNPTFGQNWMLAYNYPSAQSNHGTGSGQGVLSVECHSDAFGGSDIPESKAQLTAMDGTPTSCVDSNGNAYAGAAPFTPNGPYPNLGDFGAGTGNSSTSEMTFPIGASAIGIAAFLPSDCIVTGDTAATQPFALTSADMENIWGGFYTDWSQLVAADPNTGLASTCSGALTRVVREDNSGTTQGFDNYLADAFGTAATCDPSTTNVATFAPLATNQINVGTDVLWPGGYNAKPPAGYPAMNFNVAGCSHLISSGSSGANALIALLNTTQNGIGYADVSDIDHAGNGSTNNLTLATVEGADGAQQSPLTGTFASGTFGANCNFNGASLPAGGANGSVGLVNLNLANPGGWILGNNPNRDDISYSHQTGAYPVCSLTWQFVPAGEDGNTPPAPTQASGATVTLPASVIDVSSLKGLPNSSSFTVTDSAGAEKLSYTGLGNTTATCGGTSTACVTGVTGGTSGATIAAGATMSWPQGTGGPLANLTPDQRRTLYSYYLWLFSPEGQSTSSSVGYAPLPASWQTSILAGFKTNF